MDEQAMAVQRMQDYIDEHLYDEITLSDLAREAMYSPWYSHRLFARFLDLTPADYIRRLRLSSSALRLRDERMKIAEIAFESGFDSVDGYQRAFFREFGLNPCEWAKNPSPIYLFTPYGIKYRINRRETAMENFKNIYIQTLEKPERKAIIKRAVKAKDYFSYCEEVGCEIWGLLTSIKSISGEPVCLWLPKSHIISGTSEYVMGAEVETAYSGCVPEGFDIINLPACKYLMFQGEPFAEEDYCQAIEQMWCAIEKYNPSSVGFVWDKENPRIQLEPIGSRGYIELVPVK